MKKYTQLTYEQRYSIHLLNKDTVKLLLPNQWSEVNQAFLEHCLVILGKEVIDTISHKYLN